MSEDPKDFFARFLRDGKSETTAPEEEESSQESQPAHDPTQGFVDDRQRKASAGHLLRVEIERGRGGRW
ncbi:hypothetical protein [Saccharopolyspora sp. SCSIO 74807]|uniref:hypothetical protein n=1 Tax=Saccharopolyspora sp. SCSIO 74807 TaxID=3118084 RepID=UPI0030D4E3D6